MPIRIAFMGFRHGHIFDCYNRALASDDFEVVAACEEDEETRAQLAENGKAEITHDDYSAMLNEVDCDVIAVGDYYGKRGSLIIKALELGKHAISDKPICTSLQELDRIEALSSAKGLAVGCMLDLRDNGLFIRVRELVGDGAIGEVRSIAFGGQHPLMYGTRPNWYFEEGKHGGTINDIGIHGFDLIPWITGLEISEITAARSWNTFAEVPCFMDAGQFMLKLSNGAGVLGDVSYFMPDSMGYTLEQYWRFTIFGSEGMIETSYNSKGVTLAVNGDKKPKVFSAGKPNPGGYLESFAEEITAGSTNGLSTGEVLRAARIALETQQAGDLGICKLAV